MTRLRIWLLVAIVVVAAALYIVGDMLVRTSTHPKTPEATGKSPPTEREHLQPGARSGDHQTSLGTDEAEAVSRPPSTPKLEPKDLDGEMELSGRVLAPDGRPVAGAEVAWSWLDEATDEDGRFVIRYSRNMGPRLVATHPKYTRGTYEPVEFKADHALTGIVITLGEGGFVTGKIVDQHGRPVGGATIFFQQQAPGGDAQPVTEAEDGFPPESPGETAFELRHYGTVWAEANGEYTTNALPPGTYTVCVLVGEPLESLARTVHVEAGRTAAGVGLTITGQCEVTGWLLDWDDNPVPDVEVLLTTDMPPGGGPRRVMSGPDGSLAFRAVEAGTYWLDGYAEVGRIAGTRVTAPAKDVIVRFRPHQTLRGRVVDKQTGAPVERFSVSNSTLWRGVQEHPGGRFRLSVYPADATLSVTAPGYAPVIIETVRIVDGVEPDEILVELVRGARLDFRVTSMATGQPVPGATVRCSREEAWSYDADDPRYAGVTTDEEGTCSFDNIEPGHHRFLVQSASHPTQYVCADVGELDDTKTVDAVLHPGLQVRGRVVAGEHAKGVGQASVTLDPTSSPSGFLEPDPRCRSTTTLKTGEFAFDGVIPGEYTLGVTHSDYGLHEEPVTFGDSADGDMLVELSAGGAVAGVVTEHDGRPAADVTVMLEETAPVRSCNTKADGSYRLAGILPRRHVVAVYRRVPDGGAEVFYRRVIVGSGETTRLDIALGGRSISGTIAEDGHPCGLGTGVYDPNRPEVIARALTNSPSFGMFVYYRGKVADDSSYRIEGVEPGRYSVAVSCRGRSFVSRDVEVGDSDVRLDIEIAAGVVSGIVRLSNGCPASRAYVELEPASEDADRLCRLARAVFPPSNCDATGEDGTFAICGVLPGAYRFSVSARGHAPHVAEVVVPRAGDVTNLVIELELEPTVIAQIKTWDGAIPSAVWVAVRNEEDHFVFVAETRIDTTTGECFIYGMRPGRHLVAAEATGYARACAAVDVADEGETRLTLTFERGSRLNILVADSHGAPVHGADVLLDAGHEPELEALLFDRGTVQQTSQGGAARFGHVADGEYTVRVRCDGYEDAAVPVRIAGIDKEVTVTLRPRGE